MIVMPANHTGIRVGYVARRYEHAPARLGHLFSPGAQTGPHSFMPYALDNGAFGAFKNGTAFDVGAWVALLDWAASSGQRPLWCLVPDVVGDRAATLSAWDQYRPIAARYGWPLAFAAQDGMEPSDVPADAATVFLGGSTEWKWSSLQKWGGGVRRSPACRARQRPAPTSPLRRHRRGLLRRHRIREGGTPMERTRNLPCRDEWRAPARRPDVRVVRSFRRRDGSWVEVMRNRRTGCYWRRAMTWPC